MSAFAPRRAAVESVTGPLTSLVFDVEIVAPMPRVFAALTESALLTRWFCDRAASEARVVEYALESSGEGTALAVRHSFPSRPEYEATAAKYGSAWPRALARLEALLATTSDREQGT